MALQTFLNCKPDNEFITIDHDANTITFKIQEGPIKQSGHNGCQIDSLIDVAIHIISHLDLKVPCKENVRAVDCLYKALHYLNSRTGDRIRRGVEGTEKA